MVCRWEPFLNPFPRLFDFFLDYLLFFFSGFLPVLRAMCRWEPFLNPFPRLFWFFSGLFIVFFSGFLPVLRAMCRWKSSPHPFPILLDFFSDYFLFFSQGFCQFWEQSADENLPCILSPYYLMFFWLFFESWFCLHYFLLFCFFLFFLFWIKSLFFGVFGVCGFTTLVYLIPRSESDTASVWEQLRKILAALWSEECLCWFMG